MFTRFVAISFACLLFSACLFKSETSITLDPANYPALDFTINNGVSATNNRSLTIKASSGHPFIYQLSINEGTSCNDSSWNPFANTNTINIAGKDGEIFVSAKAKTKYKFESPCITKKIFLDSTGPKISEIEGPTEDSYFFGQSLNFKAKFSEVVTVVGSPKLAIQIGDQSRHADYVSGSGTAELQFKYDVAMADVAMEGITLPGALDIPIGSGIFDTLSNNSTGSFTGSTVENVWVNFFSKNDES